MAVAVDLLAVAATVMTAISLHLVLALSHMILMPNDITTSLSKSIPAIPGEPDLTRALSSYTIPSNCFTVSTQTKNTHNTIKQTVFNILVISLSLSLSLRSTIYDLQAVTDCFQQVRIPSAPFEAVIHAIHAHQTMVVPISICCTLELLL